MHEPRNVRQLLRAFHRRMRGENLFDQRGAGTRQSDDKDRVRKRTPRARAFREKLPRAERQLPLQIARERVRVVADLVPLQRIASLVEGERLGEISAVLERLTECKT